MSASAQKIHSVPTLVSPYEAPLDISIFVSCFNEESTIITTLQTIIEAMEVVGKTYEIIVFDDCSTDHSTQLLRAFLEDHSECNIVLRINKKAKGLAQNYTDAAFIGCGKYYRLIRGDNGENVETMVDIMRSVGDADIIVPYYISRQSGFSKVYSNILNMMTGNGINDYNSSPIHLRYNVVRWHSYKLGMGFQSELLCRLLALGFTCKQVPCRGSENDAKNSKIGIGSLFSLAHVMLEIIIRKCSVGFYKY